MRLRKFMLALCLAGVSLAATAYDLPAVNLGGTSFYDGAPAPAGPGWYLIEYLQSIHATRLNDQNGDKLGLPKQNLSLFVPLTQLLYVSSHKWGNVTPGATVLEPWVAHAHVDDGLNNAVLSAKTGLGDTIFGAFLQFDPVMGSHGPVFSQRVEMDISAPTGQYDPHTSINPGTNHWFIDPYYAFTYWITPRWTTSGRFFYLWNGKNNNPSASLGPASSSQAGQAIHANFTTAYAISHHVSLGINGYWLKQITDTKVDGKAVAGRKEQVWAIGPGMVYTFSPSNSVFVNAYFEQEAKNRSQGNSLIVRYNHHF